MVGAAVGSVGGVRRRLIPVLVALAALTAAAPAAADRYVRVAGWPGAPGPARYDRVWVNRIGPARATRVLVLVPGFYGGAGDFTLVGRDLVRRVPDLQVWALDRRSQAFEDTSAFALGPEAAYDYYLNAKPVRGRTFRPLDAATVGFVRGWGLRVALEDLHRVVLAARAGGRRTVILGGHSLGASTTAAYAAWDFDGRPGYRDIAGMVLIDGGALGTFATPDLPSIRRRLADLNGSDPVKGNPFVDLLGLNLPWVAGAFAEVGAQFALQQPDEPSVLQQYPLLPAAFKPPVRATNAALAGYAFDESTSPDALALIRVRAGQLAAAGDPRGWQDGEVTPIRRLAQTFAQEPHNATEWYFPKRLTLDVDGANALRRNAITKLLGLRPWHLAQVDVPLYAFQTDLTRGRVLRGARAFLARSRSPRGRAVLVDRSSTTSHLDPLTAAPRTNDFLKTVVPFLRRIR